MTSLAAALLLLAYGASAQAPLDVRVALVIGNGAYRHVPSLDNPANDARAVAASLRALGFQVIESLDADKAGMERALQQAQALLQGKQATGVLYYAGHGLQLDWRNYMVPVDARLAQPSDVTEQTIELASVITGFSRASTRMNIVVLDACRNNPFAGKSGSRGLAQMDAPSGTFLAYATAPGNVADDGDVPGGNSLFTGFLLKELRQPARVEDLFKRVRVQVRRQSEGRQIPWDSSSLEEDFAFNDGARYTFGREERLPAGQPTTPTQGNTATVLPGATAQDRDRRFADEKAHWDTIKASKDADAVAAFLYRYPSGQITQQALFRLEQLMPARITSQPLPNAPAQAAGKARFRPGDTWTEVSRDAYSNRVQARVTYSVDRIDDGIAYIRSEHGTDMRTLDGGIVKMRNLDGAFEFDPPRVIMPGDEFVKGRKWSSTTVQKSPFGTSNRTEEFRVVGAERVKIQAGEFDTYRIAAIGYTANVKSEFEFWVLPDLGVPVKWTRAVYRGRGIAREVYELEALTRK